MNYVNLQPAPTSVECHVLDTGYCLASEHHVIRGGRWRTFACHSIVALLQHPQRGWLLWDTGYAPRMWEATRCWPYRLYRYATPLRLQPELAVIRQLPRWGLKPADIQRILLSHLHADHVAGLCDFGKSMIIGTTVAYTDVAQRQGVRALARAFVPELLPPDFTERAMLLPAFSGRPLPGLGPTLDLFDDGSLVLVELPGHACGQIGLLAQTTHGPILFAADSCWLTCSIHEQRPPHPITNLFVDDAGALRRTLAGLHTFAQQHPTVRIVPSHCPVAFQQMIKDGLLA